MREASIKEFKMALHFHLRLDIPHLLKSKTRFSFPFQHGGKRNLVLDLSTGLWQEAAAAPSLALTWGCVVRCGRERTASRGEITQRVAWGEHWGKRGAWWERCWGGPCSSGGAAAALALPPALIQGQAWGWSYCCCLAEAAATVCSTPHSQTRSQS